MTLRSQSGMSLVGALTSATILGVVAAAFSTMSSNIWTQLGRQTAKFEQLSLAQELRTEISIPNLCAQGFSSSTQNYQPDAQGGVNFSFRFANGRVVSSGSPVQGTHIVVDRLRFVPSGTQYGMSGGGVAHYGSVELHSHVQGIVDFALKPVTVSNTFINVSPAGQMVGCFTDSAALSAAGVGMPCGPPPAGCSTSAGRRPSRQIPAQTSYSDGSTCDISGGSLPTGVDGGGFTVSITLTCQQQCTGGEWRFSGCALGGRVPH